MTIQNRAFAAAIIAGLATAACSQPAEPPRPLRSRR